MNLELLQVLLHVVDKGSVQGAARHLGVARSLLRRRLDSLEAEVGVPLLYLDAEGARLTPAGLVVTEQGRALLAKTQTLLNDARAASYEAVGCIRVFEPIGLPAELRAEGILATHRATPKLRHIIRQVEDPVTHMDEPCELVLHFGEPPDKASWFSRILLRQPMRALAAPSYLAAHGTPSCAADLAQHQLLAWQIARQRADLWPLRGGGTVSVDPWIVSPDGMLLLTLTRLGGGVLLAPYSPVIKLLPGRPIVPVIDEIEGELVLRASSPMPARADARTRETLDYMHQLLARFPDA